jgi:hypothetical protein
MRETITVQVGQCGNQIGSLFWQLLLLEHEKTPDTDAALSAYFRFAPSGTAEMVKLPYHMITIDELSILKVSKESGKPML